VARYEVSQAWLRIVGSQYFSLGLTGMPLDGRQQVSTVPADLKFVENEFVKAPDLKMQISAYLLEVELVTVELAVV
jgi:hypothetical protein